MDWIELLLKALGIGFTIILATYLQHITQKFIESDVEGKTVLRPHRFFQIFGVISVLVAFAFIIGFIIEFNVVMFIAMLVMLTLFGFFGVLCLLAYKNHCVIFDDKNLMVTDIYGNEETILWKEITYVEFHKFSGNIILKTPTKTLKVGNYIVGIRTFGYAFQTFTKWKAEDINIQL